MTTAQAVRLVRRAKRACAVLSLVVVGLAAGACGKKADTDPPMATPAFAVSKTRAPLGSPVEVTYTFTVAQGATFDQDYRVMVHFNDADEELIRDDGYGAEWALQQRRDTLVHVFDTMADPYLRTRRDDLDHVVTRVQKILL